MKQDLKKSSRLMGLLVACPFIDRLPTCPLTLMQNEEMHDISHKHKHLQIGFTAEKLFYEDELVCCGRNNTVTMDIQLIKGVLPDLFVVLKFFESNEDVFGFQWYFCHYFIKKLQVAESKQHEWWKQNSHAVRKSIDGKCASVSNLIK